MSCAFVNADSRNNTIEELSIACSKAKHLLDGARDFRLRVLIEMVSLELAKAGAGAPQPDRPIGPVAQ